VARHGRRSFAKQLLVPFGIRIMGYIRSIATVKRRIPGAFVRRDLCAFGRVTGGEPPIVLPRKMIALIEECKKEGNTLGGISKWVALGLPPDWALTRQWDRKLDGRLAQALRSIRR